jgi:N-ethylmaleimide reductase
VKAEIPRALEPAEIPGIVDDFRQAAVNAIQAGFDGVELQGANSHLIEQFLEDGTNIRSDNYGGPQENRARFLFDIVEQVSAAIGSDRLGVRLSPFGQYGGIRDSKPKELFTFVIEELNKRHLAWLHLIEARGSEIGLTDDLHADAINNAALFRPLFNGALLSAAAYTPDTAALAIEQKHADAVVFGRLFIANPDLVERIRKSFPLNPSDRLQDLWSRSMSAVAQAPQSQVSKLASQLIGVWALVSYTDEQPNREDTYPFGPQPQGFLIYTADGFVSAQLMKPDRPAFQSPDWDHGTP